MRPREWLLSICVVVFVALKLAEGLLAFEAWPFTHVPMFSEYRARDALPVRHAIQALRHGTWFEVQPWQLGLNRAELARHLLRRGDPGVGCGELVRAFNQSRPAELQIEQAYVRVTAIARPGSSDTRDVEERFDCPVAAAPRTAR